MSSGTYTFSSLCISTGTPSPLFQMLIVLMSCIDKIVSPRSRSASCLPVLGGCQGTEHVLQLQQAIGKAVHTIKVRFAILRVHMASL